MSKEKNKENTWGGAREGAGRPRGSGAKTKICVSVTEAVWHAALSRWNGKGSNLVDDLLVQFLAGSRVTP